MASVSVQYSPGSGTRFFIPSWETEFEPFSLCPLAACEVLSTTFQIRLESLLMEVSVFLAETVQRFAEMGPCSGA
jgi:hypothetical protein